MGYSIARCRPPLARRLVVVGGRNEAAVARQNAPNEATENVFIDCAARRRKPVRTETRRTKPTRYANMRRTKPPRMSLSILRPGVASVRGQQHADEPNEGGKYATNEPNAPGEIAPNEPNFGGRPSISAERTQ